MSKIWRFNIENCDIREIFKNKRYPEIVRENVWEFAWDGSWEGMQNSDTFSVMSVIY